MEIEAMDISRCQKIMFKDDHRRYVRFDSGEWFVHRNSVVCEKVESSVGLEVTYQEHVKNSAAVVAMDGAR